jgi:predicted  nucleic acid-binding Zn-ribbon protein
MHLTIFRNPRWWGSMAAPVRALPWMAGMVSTQPMTWINDLRRLQETDTALDSRRGSLADAEAHLGETEELIELRARVQELAAALSVARGDQKDVELEADELKSKITPAETKLYSGAIKNPKELADLQADIDQLKRHLSAVEDRDLEALTRLEAADNAHKAAAAELAALESAWADDQAALAARIKVLTAEVAEYDAQRREEAEEIAPEMLRTYDHTRIAHQGRALAKLDRNLCTGCRISLPTNIVNKARIGNALVQCPNCERILHA